MDRPDQVSAAGQQNFEELGLCGQMGVPSPPEQKSASKKIGPSSWRLQLCRSSLPGLQEGCLLPLGLALGVYLVRSLGYLGRSSYPSTPPAAMFEARPILYIQNMQSSPQAFNVTSRGVPSFSTKSLCGKPAQRSKRPPPAPAPSLTHDTRSWLLTWRAALP